MCRGGLVLLVGVVGGVRVTIKSIMRRIVQNAP